MLKILSLFSGVGAFEKALENLKIQHEIVNYCEIDKYASKAYSLIHSIPEDKNLGDITKVNPKELPDFDMLTYGFPCVPKGFLVKTSEGYKEIQDIKEDDLVLTYNNQYKSVVKTMNRLSDHINIIKGVGCYNLQLTDEHPIYSYDGQDIQWIKTKDLKVGNYISYNINQNETNSLMLTNDECWLLGRYCADGYMDGAKDAMPIFCIGEQKEAEFLPYVESYKYSISHKERSCYEFRIKDMRLAKLCLEFSRGAKNKEIPNFITNLPKNELLSFLQGYLSGDGHKRKDRDLTMFCTVSEKLFLGLQEIIIKVHNVVPTVSVRKDKRSATFSNCFNAQFSLSPKDQIIMDNKVFVKVKSIERIVSDTEVFNLEVADDNSYTVNNCIVHNCQDISVAGKQAGIAKGTRSGLLSYALKIIQEKKPKYAICENVKNLVGKKFRKDFDALLAELESYGYRNHWKVLNAKDYGIPQNRERVFVISIRNDIQQDFEFPLPFDNGLRLKDLLESASEVDERYYIPEEKCRRLLEELKDKQISNTVRAGGRGSLDRHSWDLVAIQQVGLLDIKGNEQVRRVDSTDGISPTLNTCGGGNRQPKIIIDDLYESRNARVYNKYSPSLRTNCGRLKTMANYRIRKLTPLECLRLQGFSDSDYHKLKAAKISDSQLYKMAGNSIVVPVIEALYKSLGFVAQDQPKDN